jgi:hypothetical protein
MDRVCADCKVRKSLELFCKDSRREGGRGSYCNECANEKARLWREKNLEKHKKSVSQWSKSNQDKRKLSRIKNKSKKDEQQYYLKKYSISKDEYLNLLNKQNGVCAICEKINKTGTRLSVDHCHKTGRIRGLLCHTCNLYLGRIEDSIDKVKKMEQYLSA